MARKKPLVFIVIGTRPEAIKMAPVIRQLKLQPDIRTKVVSTGQQREMLDQVLKLFRIKVDYNLHIMQDSQTLSQISFRILDRLTDILEVEKPNLILVHGDTPTAFMTALGAFYHRIPIGHVEAGLRTYNKYEPFPEEMNRQMIDVLCDYYFAPTMHAQQNLINEHRSSDRVFVTGNTVIDAILQVTEVDRPFHNPHLRQTIFDNKRFILLTTHRRENLGSALENIYRALLEILDRYEDVHVVFPVHLNPAVSKPAKQFLGKHPRVLLVKPLDYSDMAMMMKKSHLVLTDSGGLQEEAPSLGKPVLVLRNTTERPEGVEAGTLKLVGTDTQNIVDHVVELLSDDAKYRRMAQKSNPYGDGTAAYQIVQIVRQILIKTSDSPA